MAKKIYDYEYIHFQLIASYPKTTEWSCKSNTSGGVLGTVRWYGPWRQYCFFPAEYAHTVFNRTCLDDISKFLKIVRGLDHDRKAKEENRANTSYSTV